MNKKSTVAAVLMGFAVAAFADEDTRVKERTYQLPKCARPAVSISVGKLQCKAASCKGGGNAGRANPFMALANLAGQPSLEGIGDGMGDMLTTVLKSTGCFEIQEREAMDDLARELALVGKKVEVKQADFLISGAVTAIGMSQDRSSFGGGFIPIVGAISSTTQKANVAMDIRLIDVNNAKILDSKTFEADSEKRSWGVAGAGLFGGAGLGGAFSSLKGTALEGVVRDTIVQAAVFITESLARDNIAERVDLAAKPEDKKPE